MEGQRLVADTVSVITTVRNEERALPLLLADLARQSVQPLEIVLVDGGSTDGTLAVIEGFRREGLPLRVIEAPGANISRGRNLAIEAARGTIIAATDAGVRLAPDWLAQLTGPFFTGDSPPDVVSGFFAPDTSTTFEKAMGATVLPQLADIKPDSFLPSSRSVAFKRDAWRQVGGYPEWLDYCEDLVFDLALKEAGNRFQFAPQALALFRPRGDMRSFFRQYYRYARGDGKAGLWGKRHLIRYTSYIGGSFAFIWGFCYKAAWLGLLTAGLAYLYHPVKRLRGLWCGMPLLEKMQALALIPVIRFVGDLAKMIGYPVGLVWRVRQRGGRDWRQRV